MAGRRKEKVNGNGEEVEELAYHQMVKISITLILIKVNLQIEEVRGKLKIKEERKSLIRERFNVITTISGGTLQMNTGACDKGS